MADWGCEGNPGRGEGIGGRDEDVEVPETGWGVVSGRSGEKLFIVGGWGGEIPS